VAVGTQHFHRMSWLSGYHSQVKISARKLAILKFVMVFLSTPGKCRNNTLKSGHDRFLPNPFQFIIHISPFHSTLYSFSCWKSSL